MPQQCRVADPISKQTGRQASPRAAERGFSGFRSLPLGFASNGAPNHSSRHRSFRSFGLASVAGLIGTVCQVGIFLLPASAAQAQSSDSGVQIYGSIDNGVLYSNNSNGHSLFGAEEGNSQPNRWGLRGNEDLGNGTHALFVLENGFSALTGAYNRPGVEFSRFAYVGLGSDRYGTVTLGHQSPFSYSAIGPFLSAYQGLNYRIFHPGNLDETTNSTTVQTDNTIKYMSPILAGFSAGGMLGMGNTTNFGYQKLLSFGLLYGNGPFQAALTYSNEHNRSFSIGPTALGLTSFQGVNLNTTSYVADKAQNIGAGMAYHVGKWNLHAAYTHVRLNRLNYADTFQALDIGAGYQATPDNLIALGGYTSRLDNYRWSQAGLTYAYFFSKRTQVYVAALYATASGTNAVTYNLGPASTSHQVTMMTGIHQSF